MRGYTLKHCGRRYIDRMYRDSMKDIAKKALGVLLKFGKFLGRSALRLIRAIANAVQVFLGLETIASISGLVLAKRTTAEGISALSMFEKMLIGLAMLEYTEASANDSIPNSAIPSYFASSKVVMKAAVLTLKKILAISLAEITSRLSSKGIDALS